MGEPVGKVARKYWETGLPSQASGRAGGRLENSPRAGGEIEEWAPGLPEAISGGLEWNPWWGDLVTSADPNFRAWRESSTGRMGPSRERTWARLTLAFGLQIKECYNGHSDHGGGDSPHHVCL